MALVSQFLRNGKELCQRMRSQEGTTLSKADLQVLRDQLHTLLRQTVNLLNQKEQSQ